jgi:hypothetical protein
MPRYRIHRIKAAPGEHFRWTAHTGGPAIVKLKDYEPGAIVEAATPYAAWKQLADESSPLRPGDLLEVLLAAPAEVSDQDAAEPSSPGPSPELHIAKYIGFEPATWFIPEPKRTEMPALTVGERTGTLP